MRHSISRALLTAATRSSPVQKVTFTYPHKIHANEAIQ